MRVRLLCFSQISAFLLCFSQVFLNVAPQSTPDPVVEITVDITKDGSPQTITVDVTKDDLLQIGEDFCSEHEIQREHCVQLVFKNLQNIEFEYLRKCNAQNVDCTNTMAPPTSKELVANQNRWEMLKELRAKGRILYDPDHYRGYVGPAHTYGTTGMSHLELVAQAGLKEEHSFLDIGCGSLRLGRTLIPFLNRQRYFCLEPNAWLFQSAIRYELGPEILHLKAPTFISWVMDFKLPEQYGLMDILFAQSVFSHTAKDLLSTALSNLSGAMHDRSLLLATFIVEGVSNMEEIQCPRFDEPGLEGWLYENPYCVRYDEDFLQQVCLEKGLKLERLDWSDDVQTWYAIRKTSYDSSSTFFSGHRQTRINSSDSQCIDEETGNNVEIFKPISRYAQNKNMISGALLGPPEVFVQQLHSRMVWLDSLTVIKDQQTLHQTVSERAQQAYCEVLKAHVSGTVFGSQEKSVHPELGTKKVSASNFNSERRNKGHDWTYLGSTMTGILRLNNLQELLLRVFSSRVHGDYVETGVWRGGSSIFARGVMRAYGQAERAVYLCDSFRGLPPGDRKLHKRDSGWDRTPYLEVSTQVVASYFEEASLMDDKVVFVKGFFNDTMPILVPQISSIAVLRLDGDMYESTVDVLYHLYDKVALGGFVIIDDWYGFPAKDACEDFFLAHGISPEILSIDQYAVYWQKTEHVHILYQRYQSGQFKVGSR